MRIATLLDHPFTGADPEAMRGTSMVDVEAIMTPIPPMEADMTRMTNPDGGPGSSRVRPFKQRLLPAPRQGGFRLDG